jgi:hypothetical protein
MSNFSNAFLPEIDNSARFMRNKTTTENGMVTNISSGSNLVDLFFKMGASRKVSEQELENIFEKSYNENPLYTLKAMFYNRDIRGGQGERRSFRVFFKWLCSNHPEVAMKMVEHVPEYGRWDDLFVAFDTPVENTMLSFIYTNLLSGNKLLAKWMPREGKAKAKIAGRFCKAFCGNNPSRYRKLLAGNTEVVESLMCSRNCSEINYSHVPSIASNKYRKAFYKQDTTRYAQWVEDVKAGKQKVNASAIFPHDIVKQVWDMGYLYKTVEDSVENQWKALPNFLPEGKSFLPVCDVSGSMRGDPMLICVSLGIYIAERNIGPFQNMFFTFDTEPQFQYLQGKNLFEKVANLQRAPWGGSTNLEKTFDLLLNKALQAGLKQEDLPEFILILSDMQFNQATHCNDSAIEMIGRKYQKAGYQMPGVIFWNLRASSGVPVEFMQSGVALVSGFSPSILKTVLSGTLRPLAVVVSTLDQERYNQIVL